MGPQLAMQGIGLASSLIGGKKQKRRARAAKAKAEKKQNEQQRLLEIQKDEYRQMQFTNPYAGMENPYEDLTVATGAAEFQAQQGAQQRANIMESLKGAAGGSGIAGLAQTLANQGAQAQQISANLQQQEAVNEKARAEGAVNVDMYERQGEMMVQQAETAKQSTLLGMQYGQAAGANEAAQQAELNRQQAAASAMQTNASMFGSFAKSLG